VSDRAGWTAEGRPLLGGTARGRLLLLDQPLSMWGGLDVASGRVIDPHHPQLGASLTGRILALPSGRGSSSSSSVLAEALRTGTGPRGFILGEPDGILLVGALAAQLMYGIVCPIVLLRRADYRRLRDGSETTIEDGYRIHVRPLP
jgi:uncharacterized protein